MQIKWFSSSIRAYKIKHFDWFYIFNIVWLNDKSGEMGLSTQPIFGYSVWTLAYLFEILIAKNIQMKTTTQTIDDLIALLLKFVHNFILSQFCGIPFV